MTWLVPVLAEIATKTSTLVLENVHDAASEIEYRTVIRHEFAHSVSVAFFWKGGMLNDFHRISLSTVCSLQHNIHIAQAKCALCPWDR